MGAPSRIARSSTSCSPPRPSTKRARRMCGRSWPGAGRAVPLPSEPTWPSALRLDEQGCVLRGLVAHVGRELRAQRPRAGELEPEPEHVALLVWFGAVHELRPRVEHG